MSLNEADVARARYESIKTQTVDPKKSSGQLGSLCYSSSSANFIDTSQVDLIQPREGTMALVKNVLTRPLRTSAMARTSRSQVWAE